MGHDLFNASAHGFGRWKQCKNCGATKHSRFWWLGGFRAKIEPPCEFLPINKAWVDIAENIRDLEPEYSKAIDDNFFELT